MIIIPFTVREWYLLILVVVLFALLVLAILKVREVSLLLKEEQSKKSALPTKSHLRNHT